MLVDGYVNGVLTCRCVVSGGSVSAGTGALIGGAFGEFAPAALYPVLGPSAGFISDAVGSIGGEFIGNKIK